MTNRRTFIQTSVFGAMALARSSRGVYTHTDHALRRTRTLVGLDDLPRGAVADPASVRALAQRALEAAQAAGAPYAEVRLTRMVREAFNSVDGDVPDIIRGAFGSADGEAPSDEEELALGVRVLTDGCWGFAARSRWSMDEIPEIAAEAVRQARANAIASPQHWTPAPRPVVTGHWQPSTAVDPFLIAPEEKVEQLKLLATYVMRHRVPAMRFGTRSITGAQVQCDLTRTEWAFASSDGSYCTQQRYTAEGGMHFFAGTTSIAPHTPRWSQSWPTLPWSGLTARGWEYCATEPAYAYIDASIEQYYNDPSLVRKPVDIGRYDVVCAAPLVAGLIGRMFGPPLELDRALGLEADAGGTSYVSDPLAALGSLTLGSPLITVTGNRTDVDGLATVQWDDEGVAPPTVPLITKGVLTDYVTTRESAARLAPWYEKQNRPVHSAGCAVADSALSIPLAHPPNLALAANPQDVSLEDLVRDTKTGVLLLSGTIDLDFQGRTGVMNCQNKFSDIAPLSSVAAREIVNGKLGRMIDNVGVLFDTMQLWKNAVQLGGEKSRASVTLRSTKGEPAQTAAYSASAVPVKLTNAAIVDSRRQT